MSVNINSKSWKEKNSISAFIEVIEQSILENKCQFSISIFDIMTKAHLKNVYKDLDWQMISDSTTMFQLKLELNLRKQSPAQDVEIDVVSKSFAY